MIGGEVNVLEGSKWESKCRWKIACATCDFQRMSNIINKMLRAKLIVNV